MTRIKDEETDVCEKEGLNWVWNIKWINDCEYIQVLERDQSTSSDHFYKVGDTIQVKILSVGRDKYSWQATYKRYTLKGCNYILK